ncbi:MAG: hypothetical protein AAGB04_00325 [Pseudomonadota bacterium]
MSKNDYRPTVRFPGGTEAHANLSIQMNYAEAELRIGDKFAIEGEKEHFEVTDVLHQFRRLDDGSLRMITSHIILK